MDAIKDKLVMRRPLGEHPNNKNTAETHKTIQNQVGYMKSFLRYIHLHHIIIACEKIDLLHAFCNSRFCMRPAFFRFALSCYLVLLSRSGLGEESCK